MGRRKLPKDCHDWHEDLIRCCETRYRTKSDQRKRDYAEWHRALSALKASQDHIFIQPTGDNKGTVIGIPKSIGPNVSQYLQMVVRGDKPIIDPLDEAYLNNIVQVTGANGEILEGGAGHASGAFERGPWLRRRKYRDSTYAVLAAMYTLLVPDIHHMLKTAQIERAMRNFYDGQIAYDYRQRQYGAFKAMDQLVKDSMVLKRKENGFGGGNAYALTASGLRACYQLFHATFAPEVNREYRRVRPACGICECNEAGHIRMLGEGVPVPPSPVAGVHLPIAGIFEGINGYGFNPYDDLEGLNTEGGFAPAHTPAGRNKRARDTPGTAGEHMEGAEDDQVVPLTAEDVAQLRAKRARYYEHLTPARKASSRVAPSSSSKNPIQLDTTPPLPPPLRPLVAADSSDSQHPELQALLEYSEREALIAETRRQAREELQWELAIQQSATSSNTSSSIPVYSPTTQKQHPYTGYDGSASDTECRVPDRYAHGIRNQNQSGDYFSEEETFGEDEEEQYQRAIAESLSLAEANTQGSTMSCSSNSGYKGVYVGANTVGSVSPSLRSAGVSLSTKKASETGEVVVMYGPCSSNSRTSSSSALLQHNKKIATPNTQTLSVKPSAPITTPTLLQTSSPAGGATTAAASHHPSSSTPVILLDDSPENLLPTTEASTRPVASRSPSPSQRSVLSAGSSPLSARVSSRRDQKPRCLLPVVLELDDSPPPVASRQCPQSGKAKAGSEQEEVINLEDTQVPEEKEELDTATEVVLPRTPEVVWLVDSQEECGVLPPSEIVSTSSVHSKEKRSDAVTMLASFRNLQSTPSAKNTDKPSSRGKVLPATTAATTVTLPPPPTHLISSTTTATTDVCTRISEAAGLPVISLEEVPQAACERLVLLVDTRERFQQAHFRQFFFDIQNQCSIHLPPANPLPQRQQGRLHWQVEQEALKLGDIAFAYEFSPPSAPSTANAASELVSKASAGTSTAPVEARLWLTGTIIERKALSDLISSSTGDARTRCGTARHFTQETRLRHSGLANAFMLFEGHPSLATAHAVPLVWREADYSHPDVVETAEDVESYMCSVLARNYSPTSTVRVLQSYRNGATALLYAAFMTIELYCTQQASATTKHCPNKLAFDRFCTSLGGDKRGREAQLRRDLSNSSVPQTGVVSGEMAERVIRRFGSWEGLTAAYHTCWMASWSASHSWADRDRQTHAELRCALLLCELNVGGTRTARHSLTATPAKPGSGEDSDIAVADDHSPHPAEMLRADSVQVWLRARSRLHATTDPTHSVPHARQHCAWEEYLLRAVECVAPYKVTQLTLSASMASSYLSGYTILNATRFTSAVLETQVCRTSGRASSSGKGLKISAANSQAHSDGKYPYLYLQSSDKHEYFHPPHQSTATSTSSSSSTTVVATSKLRRVSQRMCVAVASGDDVVEALVVATSAYISAHPSYVGNLFDDPARSVAIIRNALTALSKHLPPEFSASAVKDGCAQEGKSLAPVQCVLIVEGLVHPTLATASAIGRLSARISELNTPALGRFSNGRALPEGTVSLGEQRRELQVTSARVVCANAAWLTQLFLATVSLLGFPRHTTASSTVQQQLENERVSMIASSRDSKVPLTTTEAKSAACQQCLLSANAGQTERYLYALIHETHRQSLLLY